MYEESIRVPLVLRYPKLVPTSVIGKVPPWKAIKEGVLTAVTNKSKILLFGVSYLTLLVIALIPHGLGLLILIPVTAGAMHTYYRQSCTEYDTKTRYGI